MHVPPTSPRDPTSRVLFEPMLARYTGSDRVRNWLFDTSPKTVKPSDTTHNLHTFSYACMYYPSAYVSNPANPVETPTPYLDLGDFLICHAIYDGIAVGTIYTPNETHALAIVRDSVMSCGKKGKQLGSRPRVRNFAMDLRVRDVEILEFAWMTDHSLIVACRRLHSALDGESPLSSQVLLPPSMYPAAGDAHSSNSSCSGNGNGKNKKNSPIQKLSADFLFFPVLPQACYITQPPLLRVTLDETPALCQLCGAVGVDVCRCHPSCKIRAPIRMFQQKQQQQQQQQQHNNNHTRQITTTTQTWNSPSSCTRASSGSPTSIVSSYASLSPTTGSLQTTKQQSDVQQSQYHHHYQQQQYDNNQYLHYDNHINQPPHLPNNINHNIPHQHNHNINNNHDLYNNNNIIPSTQQQTSTTTTLTCKYEDIYDDGFYNNDNLPLLHQAGEKTMSTYAHRIMDLNHGGAFFCKWFKRSACGTTLETAMTPRHPVPYQFITGTKTDTLQLISLYVSRIRLAQHSSRTNELMIRHEREEEQYQEQRFDTIEDADLDNVLDDDGGTVVIMNRVTEHDDVDNDDGMNNVVRYDDNDDVYEQQQAQTEPSSSLSYDLMSTIGNITVPGAISVPSLTRINGGIENEFNMHHSNNNTVDRSIITEFELCDDKTTVQLNQQPQLQPQAHPSVQPHLQLQQPHVHRQAEAITHIKHEQVASYHHTDAAAQHELLEGEATPPLSLSSSPLLPPPQSSDSTTFVPTIPSLPSSLSIPPPLTTTINSGYHPTTASTTVLVAAAAAATAAAAVASDDTGSGDSDENSDNYNNTRRKRHELLKYCDVSALNKKEKLRQFMSRHVENVRCMPCDRTFSKRSNLVRHIETKHFSLRPFQCDQCGKRFGHNNHLRRHKAKLHNDNTKSVSRRRLIVSS